MIRWSTTFNIYLSREYDRNGSSSNIVSNIVSNKHNRGKIILSPTLAFSSIVAIVAGSGEIEKEITSD